MEWGIASPFTFLSVLHAIILYSFCKFTLFPPGTNLSQEDLCNFLYLLFTYFLFTFFSIFFCFISLSWFDFPFHHLCFFPHLSTYSSFWSFIHADPVLCNIQEIIQFATPDMYPVMLQRPAQIQPTIQQISSHTFLCPVQHCFFLFCACFGLVFQGRWETFIFM